jgi:replicative DNA helicase
VLLYPEDVLHRVIYALQASDFNDRQWRLAFEAILESAKNNKIDQIDLIDAVNLAGVPHNAILDTWNQVYSPTKIDEAINYIKDRTLLARLQKLHTKGAQVTNDTKTDPKRHLVDLISYLSKLQGRTVETKAEYFFDKMMEDRDKLYYGKELFGVRTGLQKLDFITRGMQPNHLWIIGGYTSVGKSWLGVMAAKQFLLAKKRLLWLSFEMSGQELLWRLTASHLESPNLTIEALKIGKGLSKEEEALFQDRVKTLKTKSLYIVDNMTTWSEAKLAILYHIFAHKVDAVIVDYVQNIVVEKSPAEYDSLNVIIRDLQRMAVDNHIFILALSQLSRSYVQNESDKVFGFKGSGNLENAADVAIVFKTVTKEYDDNRRTLVVGKNRNGPIGDVQTRVLFANGIIKDASGEKWEK